MVGLHCVKADGSMIIIGPFVADVSNHPEKKY